MGEEVEMIDDKKQVKSLWKWIS